MLNALFPSVKCDDVEQIAKGEVPPDPAFVAQIDLADAVRAPIHKVSLVSCSSAAGVQSCRHSRHPFMISSLGISGPLVETDTGLVAVRTPGRVRVVRILRTGLPVCTCVKGLNMVLDFAITCITYRY